MRRALNALLDSLAFHDVVLPKKNRYQLIGADNGFGIYRDCCFKPLSPLGPGVGYPDDEKKVNKNNVDDNAFHWQLDLFRLRR